MKSQQNQTLVILITSPPSSPWAVHILMLWYVYGIYGCIIAHLFNLKFTAKQLVKQSAKAEQAAKANKDKCKKAMEVCCATTTIIIAIDMMINNTQ